MFSEGYEYITDNNINNYDFTDLVIPVPGASIKYPLNDTTNFIKEILSKDDLVIEDFNNQKLAFQSSGYYRKIIEKPKNVEYKIITHDDADIDLQNEYYNTEGHPELTGSKYKSLRLQFQLPQSTYATMLFREVSKSSSAANYQANLSQNIVINK